MNTGPVTVLFYNTENLFDTIDSNREDDEFLPGGTRGWNGYRYNRKISALFRVIVLCGGWEPPGIIGLCELENEQVLSDLASECSRGKNIYKHIYAPSADERGIGVGLMYNSRYISLVGADLWYPVNEGGDTLATRSVLSVKLALENDTINFIVTHFPSLRGGMMAAGNERRVVAALLREMYLDYMEENPFGKVIIMGDFNAPPESELVSTMIGAREPVNEIQPCELYMVATKPYRDAPGSYKYQGKWDLFDQILVSGNLLRDDLEGYLTVPGSFRIIGDDAIMTEDERYRGLKPFPTWSGMNYAGGYSDHLPVRILLMRN